MQFLRRPNAINYLGSLAAYKVTIYVTTIVTFCRRRRVALEALVTHWLGHYLRTGQVVDLVRLAV